MAQIANLENGDFNIMKFTLSGVDVSIANGIRRTLLSEIPIVVFKTTPYIENKATFFANTTRLNNEILKQRLSCIPIHIKDPLKITDLINNYIMELSVENTSDETYIVTTKDFKILNKNPDQPIEFNARDIFPPTIINAEENFIDFVRLRPKVSPEIAAEKIIIRAEFSLGNAKENSMFNVVGTCAYGNTVDAEKMMNALEHKMAEWELQGLSKPEIKREADNWKLLDGMFHCDKNSFEFTVGSIGIHTNYELINISCNILIAKFNYLKTQIDENTLQINIANSTMLNSYDIILENEDYTMGNILNKIIYDAYYETHQLTYCGFKKKHPHDTYSTIRVAHSAIVDYTDENYKLLTSTYLTKSADIAIGIINEIILNFQ